VDIFCKLPIQNLGKKEEEPVSEQVNEPTPEERLEEQLIDDPHSIPSVRKYTVYTRK